MGWAGAGGGGLHGVWKGAVLVGLGGQVLRAGKTEASVTRGSLYYLAVVYSGLCFVYHWPFFFEQNKECKAEVPENKGFQKVQVFFCSGVQPEDGEGL